MNIKQHIPNAITSLNVLCGGLAVMLAFEGSASLALVSLLVMLGAFFDFFDGLAARSLNAYSPMGKELDSLADLISFGLAPTAILVSYMKQAIAAESVSTEADAIVGVLFMLSPFIMLVFSALRLAKFNVDTRQSESFIGMPTPANALLVISLPLIIIYYPDHIFEQIIINKYFILGLTIIQSYLLVSEIPMFSFKFKNLSWADNKLRFIFLGLVTVFFAVFQIAAIPLIIMAYVLLSIAVAIFDKK